MTDIGILEGRLVGSLREEMAAAAEIGFDCFELRVPEGDLDIHPVWSDEGVRAIRALTSAQGVRTLSINADHFKMGQLTSTEPGVRVAGVAALRTLLSRAGEVGAQRVLVPFFDAGELRSPGDVDLAARSLNECLSAADAAAVDISVESTLPASEALSLVRHVGHRRLKIYYDVGNAAAFGFDVREDLSLLGDVVSGVHIKDRELGGPNVPMGEGAVDFGAVFDSLMALPYEGPYILETTPGDDPLAYATRHLAFVRDRMTTAAAAYDRQSRRSER